MSEYLRAAQRLHHFLRENFWDDDALIGPDPGVRFNFRIWRFFKSYLAFLPWADDHYYLQTQGYWVLGSWKLYDLVGEQQMADTAVKCAFGILKRQQPAGYWEYPSPEWASRIGTVEGNWAALGILASYERTKQAVLLEGAIKWYTFLINRIGFQKTGSGLAINYFANRPTGIIPNNTTLTLAFLGRLAQATGDDRYLTHCSEMVSFLDSAQSETGEFPYVIKSPLGKGRAHFQCYQYQAFQLLDLAMYHQTTQDTAVLPLITRLARFLYAGVKTDGHTQYDCADRGVRVTYHTAAIAAALWMARRMGVHDSLEAENRAYAYVLAQQHSNGGFAFSSRNYVFLSDKRYYPRYLAMIFHHLLLKAGETSSEPNQERRSP